MPSVVAIPPAFAPGPIGTRDDLFARLLAAVPTAEQQDDRLFMRTGEFFDDALS